ncbi:hypothetical protein [Aquabacterium sp.]|uniref:hypothetical protein n=1 Tax=Aquabacterium sp. TaxID=1872578 RepID=UPI0024881109|nr:hypothetical protein [Aquabacterium sp.]MDI1258993.1 hypothetical protein [Aquabacterium sp.]
MSNPNLVGLYIGTAAGALFFIYSYFACNKVPELNQVAVVLLAWTGAVVGFHLGYIALTADDLTLGKLSDQRVAIVLGALAVVWTAAESFFASIKAVKAQIEQSTQ